MNTKLPITAAGIAILTLLAVILGGGVSTAVIHGTTAEGVDTGASDSPAAQSEQDEVMGTQITADSSARYGRTAVAPEAGTYLAGKTATLQATYKSNLVQAKLEAASNESTRRAELLDGAARIEKDLEGLRTYHRNTYRSYQSGTIDEETVLLRLMFVHMAADGYEMPLERLRESDEQVPDTSVRREHRALKGDLLTMQGAVRNDVVASMQAGSITDDLHLMAHQNGTVLISLSDKTFVREAYRDDRRTRGSSPADQISSYNRKAEDLYPWISKVDPLDNIRGGPEGDMVAVDLVASDDDVVSTYMNAVTKEIIREDKRLQTGNIPTREPTSRSDGQMTIIVNQTYSAGPMQVRLVDAGTNQPLDGTIRVDGQPVGRTGADGSVWVVRPPGVNSVEATLGSRSLTITLKPVIPRPD
jgi:hypothetical protein